MSEIRSKSTTKSKGTKSIAFLDLHLWLAEDRSRLQVKTSAPLAPPFSALRLRHCTEATARGPEHLSSIFHRIPRGNQWAIPINTVRGLALGLVDHLQHRIYTFDLARCIRPEGQALLLALVKEFCAVKLLLYQASTWCFIPTSCFHGQADDPWLSASIAHGVEAFLLGQKQTLSALSGQHLLHWAQELRNSRRIAPPLHSYPDPKALAELHGGTKEAGRLRSVVQRVPHRPSSPPTPTISPTPSLISPLPSDKEDAYLDRVLSEAPILTEPVDEGLADLTALAAALATP